MIEPPRCHIRHCKHLIGVAQDDDTEATEKPVCSAFPTGIPNRIAYGPDLHMKVAPDQEGSDVFESDQEEPKGD